MEVAARIRTPQAGGVGLVALFSLSVGTIIGVGWVTLLGSWLRDAGSAGAVLAFILGGLVILPVALCYAEVTSQVSGAGGEIAFAKAISGPRAAFATGWILLLIFLGVIAFEAISVAWVAGAIFPALTGPVLYRVLGADMHLGSLLIGGAVTLA